MPEPGTFRLGAGLALLLFALLLAGSAWVGNAKAHGDSVESQPAPGERIEESPDEVSLTLSSPLVEGSRIQVLDSRFRQVDLGDTRIDAAEPRRMRVGLPPLEAGSYTVQWEAVDDLDGHRTRGSFAFELLPSGRPALRLAGLALAAVIFVAGLARSRAGRTERDATDV